jgi:uncharacterized protein (TIGR02996 family)
MNKTIVSEGRGPTYNSNRETSRKPNSTPHNRTSPDNGALLLRSIIANPDEDTPRLMFADWLDESGKPAAQTWARFIRQQIETSRTGGPDTADTRSLFEGGWEEWFGHLWQKPSVESGFCDSTYHGYMHPAIFNFWSDVGDDESWTANADKTDYYPVGICDYSCWWLVQRGFISVCRGSWSFWALHADALCRTQPVTDVILSTAPTWESLLIDFRSASEFDVAGRVFSRREMETTAKTFNVPPMEALWRLRWPSVRTWSTAPDDKRFWTKRNASGEVAA